MLTEAIRPRRVSWSRSDRMVPLLGREATGHLSWVLVAERPHVVAGLGREATGHLKLGLGRGATA